MEKNLDNGTYLRGHFNICGCFWRGFEGWLKSDGLPVLGGYCHEMHIEQFIDEIG